MPNNDKPQSPSGFIGGTFPTCPSHSPINDRNNDLSTMQSFLTALSVPKHDPGERWEADLSPSMSLSLTPDDKIMHHPSFHRKRQSGAAQVNKEGRLDGGQEWNDAYQQALAAMVELKDLLQKCSQNLEGDVAFDRLLQTVQLEFDWFHSAGLQLDGLPLGSLITLRALDQKVYLQVKGAVEEKPVEIGPLKQAQKMLETGFKYLVQTALLEALFFHSEMVSADLAEVAANQLDLLTSSSRRAPTAEFQRALRMIEQVMKDVPNQVLTDRQAKRAYKAMRILRDTLQDLLDYGIEAHGTALRAKSHKHTSAHRGKHSEKVADGIAQAKQRLKDILKTPDIPHPKKDPLPPHATDGPGVHSSVTAFAANRGQTSLPPPDSEEEEAEPEPELYNYDGMVVTASAMELLEREDQIERRGGLFERDGVVMTASALSLLQAQERMDRMDSSGQDWGPDTWDGIRGQYIPKWAKKLLPADRWPLVDDDGRSLKREDGTRVEDWFEVNLQAVEARNLLKYGMEGVVDHPY